MISPRNSQTSRTYRFRVDSRGMINLITLEFAFKTLFLLPALKTWAFWETHRQKWFEEQIQLPECAPCNSKFWSVLCRSRAQFKFLCAPFWVTLHRCLPARFSSLCNTPRGRDSGLHTMACHSTTLCFVPKHSFPLAPAGSVIFRYELSRSLIMSQAFSCMTSSVLIMNSGASHRGLVLFMKIMTTSRNRAKLA